MREERQMATELAPKPRIVFFIWKKTVLQPLIVFLPRYGFTGLNERHHWQDSMADVALN